MECVVEDLTELLTGTDVLRVREAERKPDVVTIIVGVIVIDLMEVTVIYTVPVRPPVAVFRPSELVGLLAYREMVWVPDVNWRLVVFTTIVDVITKDFVDVTVL